MTTGRDLPSHDPERVEALAALVLATPGVTGLHGGVFGEVATYAAGRRITGLRFGARGCEVHVSAQYPADLPALAETIRARVAPWVDGPVDVIIEDVAEPGGADPAQPTGEDRNIERKQVAP